MIDDYKQWRFCPRCAVTLTQAQLVVKEPDVITFEVGCSSDHKFLLTQNLRHGEVMLRAWDFQARGDAVAGRQSE